MKKRIDRQTNQNPTLRFTPTAWAKLQFLRDYGETEIGAFGISATNDKLLIEDVQLIKQSCSPTFVSLNDDAVADFFDQQVDAGRTPEQFGRIWVHTHPGDCPEPSPTDERTFERVFGACHWAVMFILAQGGQSFARLRFNHGPTCDIEIPVEVDYSNAFAAPDHKLWSREFRQNITQQKMSWHQCRPNDHFDGPRDERDDWDDAWWEYLYPAHEKELLHD